MRVHFAEQKVIARNTAQNHPFQTVEIVESITAGFRYRGQKRLTWIFLQHPKQLPQGKSNHLAALLLQRRHIRRDLGRNLQNRSFLRMWIILADALSARRPVFGK
jgi:hypothetical protein